MFWSYLLFFFSLSATAQSKPVIQVIPTPQSIEDFDHPNKGCPENSECDQVMGLQLTRWKDLLTKIKDPKIEPAKKAQYLELFRSKYGIPVEFYTFKNSQQGFKPLLYNSPCSGHNPKKNEERVLRGIAFLKSLGKESGAVWRDQAQIEVPTKELLIGQPVRVYAGETPQDFYLPLNDQPLFIKDKSLHIIREDEELFYALKVSLPGQWNVVDLDFTKLSEWEDKRENVSCPVDRNKTTPKIFGVEFCKSIWDEDLKKPVVVKMHQGCPI